MDPATRIERGLPYLGLPPSLRMRQLIHIKLDEQSALGRYPAIVVSTNIIQSRKPLPSSTSHTFDIQGRRIARYCQGAPRKEVIEISLCEAPWSAVLCTALTYNFYQAYQAYPSHHGFTDICYKLLTKKFNTLSVNQKKWLLNHSYCIIIKYII